MLFEILIQQWDKFYFCTVIIWVTLSTEDNIMDVRISITLRSFYFVVKIKLAQHDTVKFYLKFYVVEIEVKL